MSLYLAGSGSGIPHTPIRTWILAANVTDMPRRECVRNFWRSAGRRMDDHKKSERAAAGSQRASEALKSIARRSMRDRSRL